MGIEIGDDVYGYEILQRIGKTTAMASFVALDRSTGRKVVLKELSIGQAPTWSALESFRREEALLARLGHLSVPAFVESFEIGDTFCIVREFIEGQIVGDAVHDGMRMTELQASSLARQLLRVVEYLESQNTAAIHRRITASNVIVRPSCPIAFLDFSDYDHFAAASTTADSLYAVGSLVMYVMTGRIPHDESGLPSPMLDLARRHDVSPEFRAWLGRMVAPRPRDRYRSVKRALAAVSERAIDEQVRKNASLAGFARGILAGGGFAACVAAILVVDSAGFGSQPHTLDAHVNNNATSTLMGRATAHAAFPLIARDVVFETDDEPLVPEHHPTRAANLASQMTPTMVSGMSRSERAQKLLREWGVD